MAISKESLRIIPAAIIREKAEKKKNARKEEILNRLLEKYAPVIEHIIKKIDERAGEGSTYYVFDTLQMLEYFGLRDKEAKKKESDYIAHLNLSVAISSLFESNGYEVRYTAISKWLNLSSKPLNTEIIIQC